MHQGNDNEVRGAKVRVKGMKKPLVLAKVRPKNV